jgi:hypothetical protein
VSAWRKASFSFSNGNCIEVAAWRKAEASMSNGQCVEAGHGPGVVAVRDSKDPAGPVLAFSPAQWRAFAQREGR